MSTANIFVLTAAGLLFSFIYLAFGANVCNMTLNKPFYRKLWKTITLRIVYVLFWPIVLIGVFFAFIFGE